MIASYVNFLRHRTVRVFLLLTLFSGSPCLYGGEPPFLDASNPVSGMGVNIHFTDPKAGELEMLSSAGFHWIRMDLRWNEIEKTPGVYDFSAYDRLLANLDKFHIRALLILCYTNDLYDNGKPTCTDAGRAAFAHWAVAAVTHFKNRGVIWEIWNEPNGAWFWKPKANADDYAKLALTVSKAMREAAPDEMVVGPALSQGPLIRYTDMVFLEVALKAGILRYWSDITIHPYFRRQGPESDGLAYDQTRALIKKYAAPEQRIDVMCGESGYSTTWPGIDDATEGKYLARLFLFDVLSAIPLTIWYDWHDDGNDPKNEECHYGIVHYDYHAGATNVYDPKPAYDAAQTYSHELTGYRFKERVKTKALTDFVLSFTKSSSECLVAWTDATDQHEITFSAPDGLYEVTSYDGKTQTTAQATAGTLTLTLDGGPQYIKLKN